MKFMIVLALVGVANCASLFGANILNLNERGSVAVHGVASSLTYNAPALSHAVAPAFYNLPAANLAYTHTAPIAPIVYHAQAPVVYRAPTPLVYHAPAPAPVVLQAPPQFIVKTVQDPAPAPIVKTVYVNVDDSAEDDDATPTVYTATADDDSSEEVDDDSIEEVAVPAVNTAARPVRPTPKPLVPTSGFSPLPAVPTSGLIIHKRGSTVSTDKFDKFFSQFNLKF